MSHEDFGKTKVTRIAKDFTRLIDDWSWPRPHDKIGVSQERWTEYRHLFDRLGLPYGIDREDVPGGHVSLPVRGVGFAGEGREWGYLWSESAPNLVDDERQYFAVKPLDGNWYLYEWAVY